MRPRLPPRRSTPGRAITAALQEQRERDLLDGRAGPGPRLCEVIRLAFGVPVEVLGPPSSHWSIDRAPLRPLIDDADDVDAADTRLRRALEADEDARG